MKKTRDEFIKQSKKIHGDKYDYSKVEYVNANTHVLIKCNECGEYFKQTPHSHLYGQGCPFCSHRSYKYTVDEVKKIIEKKYNGKYDTRLIKEYKNNKQKLPLICDEHGYFEASLNDLNNGHGCQACGKIKNYVNIRKTKDDFINDAKCVHGDKYDYSKVEYKSAHEKVCIICPKHGEFMQSPNEHLKGKGCPSCSESKLEKEVREYLEEKNIKYEKGKHFVWLGMKHIDFFLNDYNIGIECQGIQHFKPIKFFGGDEGFKKRMMYDIEKKRICEENGVKIFYFSKKDNNNFLGEKIYHNLNEIIKKVENG